MKILHVTKKYPKAVGGDAVVVSNLQKQHEALGHQTAILTSNCDEILTGPRIYKFGLKDTPAALDHITVKRLVSLVMLFFKAFSVIAKERPDVIHAHSIDMTFFASFAAWVFRIPVVHTFHIVTFKDPNQSTLRRSAELRLAKAARLKKVTAPNVQDVAELRAAGLQQADVLPNGVDVDFWQPSEQLKPNGPFTFLSVGRLETQKGYRYLIDAAALLRDKGYDFRIIIVGDGSLQQVLKAQVQACGVEPYVTFAGGMDAPKVRSLLADADAAVFPSLYETTPLTLLEAWAMRMPVVSTPVGILQSTEQEHPIFNASLADAHSLCDAMEACIADTAMRDDLAHAGYSEAQKYTWSTIAQQAIGLYETAR